MAALAKQLILRPLIVLAGCLSFCVVILPAAAGSDPQDADSAAILQQYAAAARAGDAVAALGYLLDYEVLTRGENAPPTARSICTRTTAVGTSTVIPTPCPR